MDNLSNLVVGLVAIVLGLFGIHWTYQYLKKGKIRLMYIFAYTIYSFKKDPKTAYIILLFNTIVAVVGIVSGILFLLIYFHIIK